MRAAVIIYHKNIDKIYPAEWVHRCLESIRQQTFKDYHVFEQDYGETDKCISKDYFSNHTFINKAEINFVAAMNNLLSLVFDTHGYDVCFNVNLDDYYDTRRFQKQLIPMGVGVDICSSDFIYVDEKNVIIKKLLMSGLNIKKELSASNNIICHPSVCYSRRFWQGCGGYDVNAIPQEDLNLWKATQKVFRFYIVKEYLCYHRIHDNKVCVNPNNR